MRRTCAPLAALPLLLALAAPAPGNARPSRPAVPGSTRAAAWQTIAAQSPALAWFLEKVGSLVDPLGGNGVVRETGPDGRAGGRTGSEGGH